MLNKQQTTKPHAMKNPNNSCKRTGGLAALVLVGLLAGQAARAEVMTFETSLAPITAGSAGTVTMPAAYQPLPYVKIGYSSGYNSLYYCFSTLTAYQWDHTTTSYGGTHNVGFQTYAGSTYPITYTFDQPVSLPSFFVSTWNGGSGKNNVIIRAFSNTTGTTQLYSNMVAVAYPWSGWTTFTNLASLGTNIMRLELASATNSNAFVDDMTVNGPAMGTV
jgi:hypothetical protein